MGTNKIKYNSATSCKEAQANFKAARAICEYRKKGDACHEHYKISYGQHSQGTKNACKSAQKYYNHMRKLCNEELEEWEDQMDRFSDYMDKYYPGMWV